MRAIKNYLKDVYIPEELTVSRQELNEEHKRLYEEFRNTMLTVNPDYSEQIIKDQFDRYFNNVNKY